MSYSDQGSVYICVDTLASRGALFCLETVSSWCVVAGHDCMRTVNAFVNSSFIILLFYFFILVSLCLDQDQYHNYKQLCTRDRNLNRW